MLLRKTPVLFLGILYLCTLSSCTESVDWPVDSDDTGYHCHGGDGCFFIVPLELSTSTTEKPTCSPTQKQPTPEVPRPSGVCYTSETKTAKLRAQLTSLVQALTSSDDYRHQKRSEVGTPPSADGIKELKTICSDQRIKMIAQDLSEVTGHLWSLANRLRNVSEAQLQSLEDQKDTLIQRLREIQVFTGPQLTSNANLLKSFPIQIEEVDRSFSLVLAMLKDTRPVRKYVEMKAKVTEVPSVSSSSTTPMPSGVQFPHFVRSGNFSNIDANLASINSLPTPAERAAAYSNLYDQMRDSSQLETYEMTKLLVAVNGMLLSRPSSSSEAAMLRSKFQPYSEVLDLMNTGKACNIKSVAFNRKLFTSDPGWPEYLLVHNSPSTENRMKLEPQNGGLTFRIISSGDMLYATSSSTFSLSKRHIMEPRGADAIPFGAWKDWKLVVVPFSGGNYFKILNAEHDEVMFVDPSETHTSESHRRVFLKRYDYSRTVDMPTNGDLWSFEGCRVE